MAEAPRGDGSAGRSRDLVELSLYESDVLLFAVPAPEHTLRLVEAELQRWKFD